MSFIEFKNVSRKYRQGEEVIYALDEVNLLIDKGEFVVVLGPSGSGKSTFLNVLGGLDKVTEGTIYVDNIDISSYTENESSKYRQEQVGFVFQSFNLIPVLTVEENVRLPLLISNKEIDKEYLDELFDELDIADLKKRLPGQISGGQQQRVAIARALANKPQIILADEPTGNLDSVTSEKVLELLLNLHRKYGQTLIMITHNEKIAEMASRVIRIKNGEVKTV